MGTELSLLSMLPMASLAIAAGGLAVRFVVPSGPAKQTLIAAAFIFLLLTSGVLWQQQREEQRRVQAAAEEIITIIGNEKRTYEDILAGIRSPSHRIADAALDLLIADQRVGSEATAIVDTADRSFSIRLYFVRAF